MWHIYIYTKEYNSAIKKIAIFNNLDAPRRYYTKWNKWDGERQITWFHSYVEYEKQQTKNQNEESKPNINKHIDKESRKVVTRGEGVWMKDKMGKRGSTVW